ncbi:FRG domain-containing protein [Citrobacter braakii]|uniref:FRG domain-containing protein n=1 Tax=Citrobacter braakii TaxID=57706 RepID=UPI002B2D1056|nr:FRG domain-containing protein [Citrobacter braakii]
MFSLIMAGEPAVYDRWDCMNPNIIEGKDSFPISRMLEGTPSELYSRLIPIRRNTFGFLERLPVLFMTEVYTKEDDNNEYISIRQGVISELKKSGDDICFSFKINHNLGEICNPDIQLYKKVLELGPFALSRTHWAVKDKGLNDVLNELGLDGVDKSKPGVPTLKKVKYRAISNVKSYLDFIGKNNNSGMEKYYRGHSKSEYELIPSLFRKHGNGTYKYLNSESFMIREILTARPNEFKDDVFTIDKLVRMQHFGLPTRLLDITSNPLIALYFACCEDHDESGQVISFSTERKNIKYYDSDTVSCIANLSLIPYEKLRELSALDAKGNACGNGMLSEVVADLVMNEKSYFRNRISLEDLNKIVFLKARVNNERMQSQSGAFLLFGLDSVLPETTDDFPLDRVEITNKLEILEELAQLNISESTVYPSMEKTAEAISRRYLSKS